MAIEEARNVGRTVGRGEEELMRAMFNAALDALTAEERSEVREEREDWLTAYSGALANERRGR